MKILKPRQKPPEWPKTGICARCGTVVEVERNDVEDMTERPGEPLIWGCECPDKDCTAHIYFDP